MDDGKHIPLFDLDNCTRDQCDMALIQVQRKYHLSDIYVVSDKPGKYRAFCFKRMPFLRYIKILCDTPFVDFNFIWWTMYYCCATLRYTQKQDRPVEYDCWILPSYHAPYPLPDNIIVNRYETGVQENGNEIKLEILKRPEVKPIKIILKVKDHV